MELTKDHERDLYDLMESFSSENEPSSHPHKRVVVDIAWTVLSCTIHSVVIETRVNDFTAKIIKLGTNEI
jgi:hypothetical protein